MSSALRKEWAKAQAKIQTALKEFEEAGRKKLPEKIEKDLVWGLHEEDIQDLNRKVAVDSILFEITEKILGRG